MIDNLLMIELIIRYQVQGLYLQGVKYLNKQINLTCLLFWGDHNKDICFIEKC